MSSSSSPVSSGVSAVAATSEAFSFSSTVGVESTAPGITLGVVGHRNGLSLTGLNLRPAPAGRQYTVRTKQHKELRGRKPG